MLAWDFLKIVYKEFTSPWVPDDYIKFVDREREIKIIKPDQVEEITYDVKGHYPISLLNDSVKKYENKNSISNNIKKINHVFHKFNISAIARGHVETMSSVKYEVELFEKTTVSQIKNKIDDLKLVLDVENISFSNSSGYLGLVIGKEDRSVLSLKEILTSKAYANSPIKYKVALGFDDNNKPVICNLESMESIMIAGTKGSGKSSTVHTFILSLLFALSPSEIQFMFIDTKHTELPKYNGIPHLMCPCVENLEEVMSAFAKLEEIMTERNILIGKHGVSKLSQLNKIEPLPYIVCLIEEYAMLMNSEYKKDFNRYMKELTAVGRAAGIYIVLVTQNPNSNIIDSTVNANFTTRIALKVALQQHSQIILGDSGAEELLGKGDMIYSDESKTIRLQGCYVESEISRVVSHLKSKECNYIHLDKETVETSRMDSKYEQAKSLVIGKGRASKTMLRDNLDIGDSRAIKLLEQLKIDGIISKEFDRKLKGYEILRRDEDV